jgi:hypothetical protein
MWWGRAAERGCLPCLPPPAMWNMAEMGCSGHHGLLRGVNKRSNTQYPQPLPVSPVSCVEPATRCAVRRRCGLPSFLRPPSSGGAQTQTQTRSPSAPPPLPTVLCAVCCLPFFLLASCLLVLCGAWRSRPQRPAGSWSLVTGYRGHRPPGLGARGGRGRCGRRGRCRCVGVSRVGVSRRADFPK